MENIVDVIPNSFGTIICVDGRGGGWSTLLVHVKSDVFPTKMFVNLRVFFFKYI